MDYLSFDLGASSGRMVRGRFDGRRLTTEPVHTFANQVIPLGSGLYWDFLGIYRQMCTGLKKAAAEKPFHSFGIDSFNNDFSFIDHEGRLLMPLRSYRDPRTEQFRERIYSKIVPRDLYRFTGNQIAPFNTFMQLAAMREEGHGYLLEEAYRLLFLPDLLGYYVTGEQYTEYSIASETQMLDWESRDWIEEVLNLLQIKREVFAPIVMPGTSIGPASRSFQNQLQVPEFMHVAVCEHDTASAFLAAPAATDTAILSCGTWTIFGAENDQPVITDFGFEHNIANEGSLPGHHRISYNVMGLWLIQQLREDFALSGQPLRYEDIQRLALEAAPFAHLINPDNAVFFSPGEMAQRIARHSFGKDGALDENDPGPLLRCVYESLAMQYRWALERIETLLKRKFTRVSLIGGGSRDVVLCQFTANALNLPVMAGPVEASSIGNLLVQMLAHGDISSITQGRDIVRTSFEFSEFLPQDTDAWQEAYHSFLAWAHPGRDRHSV